MHQRKICKILKVIYLKNQSIGTFSPCSMKILEYAYLSKLISD